MSVSVTHEKPESGTNRDDCDTTVLEMLASRICHDLISPVGAVNNGVEFLQETGAHAGDEAIDLIAYSAHQASAKLQAFRLAYGAGGRDPNIKPEDVHRTFGELIGEGTRVSQDWDPHTDLGQTGVPLGLCKILMGTLMLAAEVLPRGGQIRVLAGGTGETIVTAEGQDAGFRPHMEDALARALDLSLLDPRLVHAYTLSMIAAHYGFTLRAAAEETGKVSFSIIHAGTR
jgi:histidine phosphotransferase ChpT